MAVIHKLGVASGSNMDAAQNLRARVTKVLVFGSIVVGTCFRATAISVCVLEQDTPFPLF